MFYTEPKKEEKPKRDITLGEAIAAVVFVLMCGSAVWLPKLEHFYFVNFEEIYEIVFAVVIATTGVLIWAIRKRTEDLSDRWELLNQLHKSSGAIFIGQTEDKAALYLSEKDRCSHVQIIGSNGRGKTESVIVPWLCRDIKNMRNIILIDGKGDPEIVDSIARVAETMESKPELLVFDLGNPDKSSSTNPLEFGSPQQITDRIFTTFTFDSSYYKSVQYDVLGSVIQLIQLEGPVTFRRIHELLTNDAAFMKALSICRNEALKVKLSQFLQTSKTAREEKLSGLISQIAPFAVGEVAPLVNGNSKDPNCAYCSVSEILLEREYPFQRVLIILIPTLKYQEIGHQLGKLLMQELGFAVGERASRKGALADFIPVFLDEFSAFVYPGFTNILNKARSSKVALHLSHQSMGDLGIVSSDFAQIVTTNTNVKCILGLNDPETADFMARHMGTETEEKVTERGEEKTVLWTSKKKTGDVSIREVEAYKIHPNLLKNYMNGKGVIHLPTPLGNISEEIQFERLSQNEIYGKEGR